jgi:hypothetical protein
MCPQRGWRRPVALWLSVVLYAGWLAMLALALIIDVPVLA